MIILRQKEFATGVERMMVAKNKIQPSPTNKVAIKQLDHAIPYKKKEIMNKLTTFPQRFMRGYYDSRLKSKSIPSKKKAKILELRNLTDKDITNNTKSKRQLLKDIVTSKDEAKLRKLERKTALAGGRASATKYVGDRIVDFVNMSAENPISTAGMIVGYGSTPYQVARRQYWGPLGEISLATEQVVKKGFPKYRKLTERSARFVKKHHISDTIGGIGQGILNAIPG